MSQVKKTTYAPARNNAEMVITKMQITMMNEDVYDIRDMVAQFKYYESIEASFLRAEFTIIDAIDFNELLQGAETIELDLETASAISEEGAKDPKRIPLQVKLQVYKIGDIIKSERGQMYNLYCVSPEMFHDEMTKILKAFGPGKGSKDVENIPLHICKEYLKAGKKAVSENFENHSKITYISCNWKPSDAIAYMTDKVTRLTGSKGAVKQSGYLFFENRNGFNFKSIDSIADGGATKYIYTYTYVQPGTDPADGGVYGIESIDYPDKANHLQNMRRGTYKSAAIGIALPVQSASFTPTSGSKSGDGGSDNVSDNTTSPGGTVGQAFEIEMMGIFGKATTVEKVPPYKLPEFFDNSQPTRMKLRALPGMKNQPKGTKLPPGKTNVGTGGNPDIDAMAVAQYASGRYNLLKSIQLKVKIPGNTGIGAGYKIKVIIPASRQESDTTVKQDKKFSGLYVVAALTHTYEKEGLSTELLLIRDSLPK